MAPVNRARNKKYDQEILSDAIKNALEAEGIPEAFGWLEEAVAEADIPVGRALEQETPPGAVGPLHEVGAGQRKASVQVITAPEEPVDAVQFWRLPPRHDAPATAAVARPLPMLRYSQPSSVPAELKQEAASDDEPLAPPGVSRASKRKAAAKAKKQKKKAEAKVKKAAAKKKKTKAPAKKAAAKAAKQAAAKGRFSTRSKRRRGEQSPSPEAPTNVKRRKMKPAPEPAQALTADDVKAGDFVVTLDEHPGGLGFNVSKLHGRNQGTHEEPAFFYKHYLGSVLPTQSSIVDAKFGYGSRSSIVDGGSSLLHGWSIVAVFLKLEKGSLPKEVRKIVREHPNWKDLGD